MSVHLLLLIKQHNVLIYINHRRSKRWTTLNHWTLCFCHGILVSILLQQVSKINRMCHRSLQPRAKETHRYFAGNMDGNIEPWAEDHFWAYRAMGTPRYTTHSRGIHKTCNRYPQTYRRSPWCTPLFSIRLVTSTHFISLKGIFTVACNYNPSFLTVHWDGEDCYRDRSSLVISRVRGYTSLFHRDRGCSQKSSQRCKLSWGRGRKVVVSGCGDIYDQSLM